jgi:hypothetical protein
MWLAVCILFTMLILIFDPIFDVPVKEIIVFTQDNGVNYRIALISAVEDLRSIEGNSRDLRFI